MADLDRAHFLRTYERAHNLSSAFRRLDEYNVAHRLGITAHPEPDSPLTLAGLLTFGEYPQRLYPQLHVAFVVPAPPGDPRRFTDSITLRGNIGTIVQDAYAALNKLSMTSAEIDGTGRKETSSMPLTAFREAVVNAIAHRTYHPMMISSGIIITVHPDRITIDSPGGIFGGQSVEHLGLVPYSIARNGTLLTLLSDTYLPGSDRLIAENRASGLLTMRHDLTQRGLQPPVFTSTPMTFQVELPLTKAAPHTPDHPEPDATSTPRQHLMHLLHTRPHTTAEVADALGVSESTARRHLQALVEEGTAEPIGAKNSPKRAYTLRTV